MAEEQMPDPLAELAGLEGVPSAVSAAVAAVDAVLRDRGRRTVSAEQSATALLGCARASAALAEDDHAGDDQLEWEPGAVRLYIELTDIAPLIRVAPGQAIARAHAVLGRGLLADDQLGRARADDQLGDRLVALHRTLAGRTAAPALVVAAIAHAELITIAPFAAGNGIVARAVEHMILIDTGVDQPPVTLPERAHLEGREQYRQAVQGYRTGTLAGVRGWLVYVAAAVAKGADLSVLKPLR